MRPAGTDTRICSDLGPSRARSLGSRWALWPFGGLDAEKALGYQAKTNKQIREAFMGVNTSGGHPAMDYAEHNRTYANFLGWTKVAIVFLVTLLAGMAFFLV
jgi:hypothetical protein